MKPSRLQEELRQSVPFSSLQEEVLLNLARTADQLLGEEATLLKGHGVSPAQYNVLRILRGAGAQGHPCQEIAARMISRLPDVTRLVDRLEAAGLVRRQRSEQDRRVVRVHILKDGLDLLKKLDKPVQELPRRLLGHLTESELEKLNRLLVKARTPS